MDQQEVKKTSKILFIFYTALILGLSYLNKNELVKIPMTFIPTLDEVIKSEDDDIFARAKKLIGDKKQVVKTVNIEGIKISKIKGRVLLRRGKNEIQIGKEYTPALKDVLETKEKSLISFTFGPQGMNKIIISPNSVVRLDSLFNVENSFDRRGNRVHVMRGRVLSLLKDLMGTTFDVTTKFCSFAVRGTRFLVRVSENKSTFLSVEEGSVESFNIVNSKKGLVKAGHAVVYTKEGRELPLTKPELLEEVKREIKNLESFNVKTSRNTYDEFFENLSQFEKNSLVINRLRDLAGKYQKKLALNKLRFKQNEQEINDGIKKLRDSEESIERDLDCLSRNGKCRLENETYLLQKGLMRTSGSRTLNKKTMLALKKYFGEQERRLRAKLKDLRDVRIEILENQKIQDDLKKLNANYYPEDIEVPKSFKTEVKKFSKVAEDKDLERFLEDARW